MVHSIDTSPDLASIIGRLQTRFIHGASAADVFDPLLADLLQMTGSEYGFVAELMDSPLDGHRFLRVCVLTDISWNEATRKVFERHRSPIIIASLVLNVVNAQLSERLRERALTDELTGLMTRRGLHELADAAQARAHARSHCAALLMIDIDHFKRVNDEHSHSAGDEVLRHAARVIGKAVRGDALVTRYGGEEFVVLLDVPDFGAALQVAERLRSSIASSPCRCRGKLLRITVSIGVSAWTERETLPEALHRTDEALYRAKGGGRDRVEAESGDPGPVQPPALRVVVSRSR